MYECVGNEFEMNIIAKNYFWLEEVLVKTRISTYV